MMVAKTRRWRGQTRSHRRWRKDDRRLATVRWFRGHHLSCTRTLLLFFPPKRKKKKRIPIFKVIFQISLNQSLLLSLPHSSCTMNPGPFSKTSARFNNTTDPDWLMQICFFFATQKTGKRIFKKPNLLTTRWRNVPPLRVRWQHTTFSAWN